MRIGKGIDISFSPVTPDWVASRQAEGFVVFAQCLWTGGLAGNDGILAVAENNLRCFRQAGASYLGYANASPPDWWPLSKQMFHTIENAGAEWGALPRVAIDLEIPGLTFERAQELADAIAGQGKATEIGYSAAWFWKGHMGNTGDIRWKQRFPRLWNAFYDSNPDIDYASAPYGPWILADLAGEQYQGTTYIEGVQVDLNVFDLDLDLFEPEQEDDMDNNQAKQLDQVWHALFDPVELTGTGWTPPRWALFEHVAHILGDGQRWQSWHDSLEYTANRLRNWKIGAESIGMPQHHLGGDQGAWVGYNGFDEILHRIRDLHQRNKGPLAGSFVRRVDTSEIFLLEWHIAGWFKPVVRGIRTSVSNPETFLLLGGQWDQVIELDGAAWARLEKGTRLGTPVNLI